MDGASHDAFIAAHRARRLFSTQDMLALRDAGLNMSEAARRLGVTDDALRWRCRSEGLEWPLRRSPLARMSDADFRRLWACHRITTEEMAATLKVTRQAVSDRARRLGLPPRAKVRRRFYDPATLTELWNAGVRLADIAAHFGFAHSAAVSTAAGALGLPRRRRARKGGGGGEGWIGQITMDEYREKKLAEAMRASLSGARRDDPATPRQRRDEARHQGAKE